MLYDITDVPDKYHLGRSLQSSDMNYWINLVQNILPDFEDQVLIDLGCGTGRFSEPLSSQLRVPVIGVDPSLKMLGEATGESRPDTIEYREGTAEDIPVPDNFATLIFMSNAIHHIVDIGTALQEIKRALKPKGIIFIRNYSIENLQSLLYMPFFPDAFRFSQQMLWSREALINNFVEKRFTLITQGTVNQISSPDVETYIKKIESRVYSDLALISDEAFNSGINKLKKFCSPLVESTIMEEVDYFGFQLC